MRSPPFRILQVLMWGVCLTHVFIGAGLNLSADGMVASMASSYGAEAAEWSTELLYIVKPLGAFMLVLGLLAGAAAVNPRRHAVIVYGFAVLFVIRALQRIFFSQDILDTFGISQGRNLGNAIFFLVLAVVVIVLERMTRRSVPTVPA